MYWLTENSMVPMLTGAFMTFAFLGFAFWAREKRMLYVALAIAGITSAIVCCEFLIVTDEEEVTAVLQDLAVLIRNNDQDGVVRYISKSQVDTIASARREMSTWRFSSCRLTGIKAFNSNESGGKKTARVVFVALGRANSARLPEKVPFQVEITLDLEKESDGVWRFWQYSYANPRVGL